MNNLLDEFRSTNITWDKATRRIYSPINANASDSNGRKLNIQVVNSGQVENLTGATLHLYWETKDKAQHGLDAFTASDISKGEFEIFYTTGMLSNVGELNATLVLVDSTGKVVSDWFKITVTRGINEGAIESENSFSSLTQALIDISNLEQNYAPRLNDLTTQLQQTEQELSSQLAQTNEKLNVFSITLNVPTDFPTLVLAFKEIERKFYATRASVYVNIEAGHTISEGVNLKSRDYRHVTIQSEDPVVFVSDTFTGDVLKGSDCHFPIFNILVDMKKLGSIGLGLYANANATVKPGCGVINAGTDGVFVNRLSQLYVHEANFSGAARYGMFVDHANTVYARYINLDNCRVGLRATKGSVVEVANGSIQNCQNAILIDEGSKVIGITDPSEPTRHLNVSGSTGNAIDLTQGSEFIADKVIIENCKTGIVARRGSKIVCSGTGIVNCGEAMKLSGQSTAYMGQFYMNTITGTAISVSGGSFLQAESSDCHVSGIAFTIKNGSRVNLDGSDLTNCGTPVRCTEGSHANCYNVDATGHTENYAFYVYYGSTINAFNALGALRVPANTLTSDGYIIQ